MSAKNMDNHNRFRCRQVAFRLSPEEADLLDTYVKLSGLTKQDYITRRLLAQDVVVQGNPRIFKALRNQLDELLQELRRLSNGENMSPELLETIHFIAIIMNGMKEESDD
jgi:hypothetical protein